MFCILGLFLFLLLLLLLLLYRSMYLKKHVIKQVTSAKKIFPRILTLKEQKS